MTVPCHKFEAAVARFDAVHRDDPGGAAVAYHARLARWVARLNPEASEPLRLAAHCQHIRRWTIPRDDFPKGLAGYKRWRTTLARMHAKIAAEILSEVGYDQVTVDAVKGLLMKKGLGALPEVQLFEDAICVAFIEAELDAFAAKHDADKMVRILRKTWKKMSPQGHEAATSLVGTLDESTQALIARALNTQA